MDGGAAPAERREPPPLTDFRQLDDQTLDGIAVATYEFFVRESGRLHGPVRMYVAKETGLPARIALTDPRGGMQMDYFGFNQGSEIEIPACLAEHK